MIERIEQIQVEAVAAIESATTTGALEQVRVTYLGRSSELTGILRGIAELPSEERGPVGKASNQVRAALEQALEARASELDAAELESNLGAGAIDVTLPGSPAHRVGHLSLITRTRRTIEDIMIGLGYRVLEGPEVELDHYNFTALNHPPGHPARMLQDTFYVAPGSLARELGSSAGGGDEVLLRTHTSPMQPRAMETQPPPIFIIIPGKVYRRDSDATHSPMFHQVEGLAVGHDITLADLQGTLLEMLRGIFGAGRETRMRPHYFPFTEPSVEFDVSCFQCEGSGDLAGGERCNLCKGAGWIEIGGAGMVDPSVFGFVEDHGYSPGEVQGFAFGMGVERIAMLRHGVPDLRKFFEGDVRMSEQFS